MSSAEGLSQQRCKPCEGHVQPMSAAEVQGLLPGVPGWKVVANGRCLRREWRARDFAAAMDLFRRVADIAEAEGHHPDLHLVDYRDATIELWTHAVNGLTENDFILAAKINELPVELKT